MSSASPAADRDRHPERRAKAESFVPARGPLLAPPPARRRRTRRGRSRPRRAGVGKSSREASRPDARMLGRGRAHELEALIARTPEDRRVRAERRCSLGADRRRRALDVVRAKARSNPQDPVERQRGTRARARTGAHARAPGRRDPQRVPRSPRHPDVPSRSRRRAGSGRPPVPRQPAAAPRSPAARTASAPLRPGSRARTSRDRRRRSSSFAGRLRDRRPRGERKAEARLVRRACNSRIDDDEVRPVDQPERGATSSDQRGRPRDEGLRDVGRRDGGREGRGELLQTCHVAERRLGLGCGDVARSRAERSTMLTQTR